MSKIYLGYEITDEHEDNILFGVYVDTVKLIEDSQRVGTFYVRTVEVDAYLLDEDYNKEVKYA